VPEEFAVTTEPEAVVEVAQLAKDVVREFASAIMDAKNAIAEMLFKMQALTLVFALQEVVELAPLLLDATTDFALVFSSATFQLQLLIVLPDPLSRLLPLSPSLDLPTQLFRSVLVPPTTGLFQEKARTPSLPLLSVIKPVQLLKL
jgi:hypothetical protein